MTNFTKRADLTAMKANKAALTTIIKTVLKVDAGSSSVLDIQAVAEGFTDYNTAKGLTKKDFYSIKCNLGTRDKPFYVERELGYVSNVAEAQRLGRLALTDCSSFMTWNIFKNDVDTKVTCDTSPDPKKGFEYQITIYGETMSDIESAVEEASCRIARDNYIGYDHNETGGFHFIRAGEEYDAIANINIEPSNNFVIIDAQGIISRSDDFDEIIEIWDNRVKNIESYDNLLIFAENVSLGQAEQSIDYTFHCIATNASCGVISGDYEDIIEAMKDDERSFSVFREIERDII